ncbi:hypothetical protein [Bacillus horti]|uniref:Uncharacterized protein n=1 Tax=Caldalkalibacillus horti TaxID=77523 RepID=A0ABT9VWN8_9BACI|nr:hypothetical protein [Bacillus horti]MDQ0165393.1 hypothetical protein [Bacillus horti]
MSYYHSCRRNVGRGVQFRTHDGRVHRGVITRVTPSHLYYRPYGAGITGLNSEEVKAESAIAQDSAHEGQEVQWGWGWGFGAGFGTGIAFGAIASLAFLPFFFW